MVSASLVLGAQFKGVGQVCEFKGEKEERVVKLALCKVAASRTTSSFPWKLVFLSDN